MAESVTVPETLDEAIRINRIKDIQIVRTVVGGKTMFGA